jgi:glycosyltransferase involved in cell wall biosynthesis
MADTANDPDRSRSQHERDAARSNPLSGHPREMNGPLVSVVLSSYNRPHMLRAAVLSVFAQTYQNLEIIIQDDSTNEDCMEVVSGIGDPRIRYTRNVPSLGTIGNLRAGYRKCTGKYFSTLNDDDLYAPEYIETMVYTLESNSAYVLAFCDHWLIDGEGVIDESATDKNSAAFGRSVLAEGTISNSLETGLVAKSIPGMFAVFRRSEIDLNDFPDEVSSGYDYWLTYLGLRNGHSIYYNPRRLTYYRVHSGSQTSGFTDAKERLRSLAYTEYMHTRFLADTRLKSVHPPLRKRLAETYTSTGAAWLRLGKKREAWQQFVQSLKTGVSGAAVMGCILCFVPGQILEWSFNAKQNGNS